jgi:hypothetical protein
VAGSGDTAARANAADGPKLAITTRSAQHARREDLMSKGQG